MPTKKKTAKKKVAKDQPQKTPPKPTALTYAELREKAIKESRNG